MKTELIGKLEFLGVAQTAGTFITTPVDMVNVDFGGFPGDRHYGITMLSGGRQPEYPRGTEIRNNRQFSLLSSEELTGVAAGLGLSTLQPEWMGGNLVLSGIADLTRLPPLARIFFQSGAVLVIRGENAPCIHAGNAIQKANPTMEGLAVRFVEVANHRRGVVGWVERPGLLRMGETARIIFPV